MSNHWDLHCRTCGETHDLDWNNAGEQVQSLISLLPDLAKTDSVMMRLDEEYGWRFDLNFPFQLARFAVHHNGHDLIARDEYGKFFDACGQRYSCPCCDHPSNCKLPHGHDGEHGQLPKEEK